MTGPGLLAADRVERDEFLRGVVGQLVDDNVRWPGLWTRLDSLLAERDRFASELDRVGHQLEMAVRERDRAWAALGRMVTGDAVGAVIEATVRGALGADRVGS